ncbi:MFS transporter, partial [Nostoc sp. NIES-2111]
MLLDMIGIGIVLPVLPAMIENLAGVSVSGASTIGGWLMVSYAAMQFLCGPLLGNLSDAYGRRPVLLLSVAGLGIDYVLTAFAPTIGWLFAGRLLAGLFGASYSTANAYIADITAPADRAKAFGMIGAAFGVGFVLGPAIGGLLGEFGPRLPFMVAAGLSFL